MNDILFNRTKSLFKFYFLALFIMFLFRVGFVGYFGSDGIVYNQTQDLLTAFFWGWKYDTLVISYLLAPVVLLNILTSIFGSTLISNLLAFFTRSYLLIGLVSIIFILLCDMSFYNYFQDHINILFFGMIEDDTQAIIETLRKNYLIELLITLSLFFVGIVVLYFLLKNFFPQLTKKGSTYTTGFLKYIFVCTILLFLLFGGVRGGYSDLVIAPKYSDFSNDEFINQAALNGLVTLEKAIKLRRITNDKDFNLANRFGYGGNIQKAFSDYLGMEVLSSEKEGLSKLLYRQTTKKNFKKPHVVILLMESFGGHWINYNNKDFNFLGDLETHFKEDIYFPHFISADNGTIGTLMTLVSSIPNRPGARFLSESRYMQHPIESALHLPFKNQGYHTSFYYGGKLGWRDIGKYLRYQKYDELIGENAIKKELSLNGRVGTEWGVYDEHLFNGISKKLNNANTPQFILALSTTNHPPFETPENYKNKNLQIPDVLKSKVTREKENFLNRFKAFEYSNQVLAKFISQIKNSNRAEDTIVVVTGDHNFWGFMNYSKSESFSKHTVPLYFYLPKDMRSKKEFDTNKVASHKDIGVTLYELILSEQEYISFGTNLFSRAQSYAFNTNIFASERGAYYKGQPYLWDNLPLIQSKKHTKGLSDLIKHYQATLSVADYFLKESFKNRKTTN